jgi:hypothetical protein
LLISESRDRAFLILVADHLVADNISMTIFQGELRAAYSRLQLGTGNDPLPRSVHYPDFAAWQNTCVQTGYFDAAVGYWEQQWLLSLGGQIWRRNLPFDVPARSVPTIPQIVALGTDLTIGIRRFSAKHRNTLYVTCVVALAILFHRYSGSELIGLWTNLSNRAHPETMNAIGWFVNTHILVVNLRGNPTVEEALNRARMAAIDAITHQEVPTTLVWRKLGGAPGGDELTVYCDFINWPQDDAGAPTALSWNRHTVSVPSNERGLHFWIVNKPNDVVLRVSYNGEEYSRASSCRMLRGWRRVLLWLIENGPNRISSIPVEVGTPAAAETQHL